MAIARIEHEFFCSEATFWDQVFFDPEYNRRLFLEELGFLGYRLLKLEQTEDRVERVQEITPRMIGVPPAIQGLIGGGFSYLEHSVFERASRRLKLVVTPSKLADKIDFEGDFYTEPLGEHRCRRLFEARVSCRVLGLGGLLERQIISDLRRNYDLTAAFTNRYLAERGLK